MLTKRTALQSFLAVVEHGTVHGAAVALNLSQPAITRQIKMLEGELGGVLFVRSPKGMELTQFGSIFLRYARQVEQTWRYALGELRGFSDGEYGTLRVGAGPAWAYSLLPDVVVQVQRSFPNLKISIVTRISEYYDMLDTGLLDIVVAELPKERSPTVVYEPLLEIDRFVFARKEHPLAVRGQSLHARELLTFPWVSFLDSLYGPSVLLEYFSSEGLLPPQSAVETTSFQSGFRILQKADHLMMLPGTLEAGCRDLGLEPLPIVGRLRSYEAGIIYKQDFQRVKPYALFVELMRKATEDLTSLSMGLR